MSKLLAGVIGNGSDSNDPELIVDSAFRGQRHLDKHIASVSLRTKSNDVTDGYDLALSACFGSERVRLRCPDFEVDVRLSIRKAEIVLVFPRSDMRPLETLRSADSEGWTRSEAKKASNRSEKKSGVTTKGEFNVDHKSLTAAGSLSGKFERTTSGALEDTIELKRALSSWRAVSNDTIALAPPTDVKKSNTEGEYLEGQVIPELTGWHVTPRSKTDVSGVIARINVREDWLNFTDPEYSFQASKTANWFKTQIESLFTPERALRRKYFMLLLERLAHQRLAELSGTSEATIAIDALVVIPNGNRANSLSSAERITTIDLPQGPIETYLKSEEGFEEATLLGIGIRPKLSNSGSDKSHPEIDPRESFVPRGSPPKAVAALIEIHMNPGRIKSQLEKEFGQTEIQELRTLKLIYFENGMVFPKDSTIVDPVVELKRAISLLPGMRAARALLLANPTPTRTEIADAVGKHISKNWPAVNTKKKRGARIRRWILWVEPHLIDPSISKAAAHLVENALSSQSKPGRRPFLNSEQRKQAQEWRNLGRPVRKIAEHFGVSYHTIINHTIGPRGGKGKLT